MRQNIENASVSSSFLYVYEKSLVLSSKTFIYSYFFLASLPTVYYGVEKSALLLKKHGSSDTYNSTQLCAGPASTTGFIDPGMIHDVLLEDLRPNTLYYYRYGSADVGV